MPEGLPIHIDDVPSRRWEYGEVGATRRRLGVAAKAKRLGIALIEIDPGKRSTPPHAHADEDEVFLVMAGGGLSYQTSGPHDVRTYAIGVDDLLWHPANGDAHTLIAGEEGLTVLVAAEGSRTNITYLPRTEQFWLGPAWSPADSAQFRASRTAMDATSDMQSAYSNYLGITYFSEVYFNVAQTAALVYVLDWCGNLCSQSEWVYLEKQNGTWVRRSGKAPAQT